MCGGGAEFGQGALQDALQGRHLRRRERSSGLFRQEVEHRAQVPVRVVPVAAADLVEDVMLDPRLDDSMVATISAALRSAGATAPISRSNLYRLPKLAIEAE